MLPILGDPKCIGARSKGLEPRRPVGVRARRLGQIFTHNSTHPHRRPRSSRAGQASHAPASTLAAGPRVSSHPRRVPATAARALDLRADRPPRDARTGRPFAVHLARYCACNPVALGRFEYQARNRFVPTINATTRTFLPTGHPFHSPGKACSNLAALEDEDGCHWALPR